MRVYRFEHVACKGGHHWTGYRAADPYHGSAMSYCGSISQPGFGKRLSPPSPPPNDWERCAVTAADFLAWWGYATRPQEYDGWALVAYDLDPARKGTEWRYTCRQVVLDTYGEGVRRIGRVDVADVEKESQQLNPDLHPEYEYEMAD